MSPCAVCVAQWRAHTDVGNFCDTLYIDRKFFTPKEEGVKKLMLIQRKSTISVIIIVSINLSSE